MEQQCKTELNDKKKNKYKDIIVRKAFKNSD
jgi:hypothetical protein